MHPSDQFLQCGRVKLNVRKRYSVCPPTRLIEKGMVNVGGKASFVVRVLLGACTVAILRVVLYGVGQQQLTETDEELVSTVSRHNSRVIPAQRGKMFVETSLTHDDPRYDKMFDGGMREDLPSRAFVWPGRNLCYDGDKAEFVASSYHPNKNYVPIHVRNRFPDRFFIRRVIKLSSVTKWVEGTTIVNSNFPLNQTTSHTYFMVTPAFHALRFAIHELGIPVETISLLFDNSNIPKDHTVQRQFFESSFIDIPKDKVMFKDDLRSGIICFRRVILLDRMSAPSDLRFTSALFLACTKIVAPQKIVF
jgi:hypothetical protein